MKTVNFDKVWEWCKEYNVNSDMLSCCVDPCLVGATAGRTHYTWVLCSDNCYHIFAEIQIHTKTAKMCKFLIDSVLWHEFCHAECAMEDDVPNGHDKVWLKKTLRKPLYVLGDFLVALLWVFY